MPAKSKLLRSLSPKRVFTRSSSKKKNAAPKRTETEKTAQSSLSGSTHGSSLSGSVKRNSVTRMRSFGASLGGGVMTDCSQQMVLFDTPSEGLQLAHYSMDDEDGNNQSDDPFSDPLRDDDDDSENPASVNSKHGGEEDHTYPNLTDGQLLQSLESAIDYEKHVLVARYLKELDRRSVELPGHNQKRRAAMLKVCRQVQEVVDSHSVDASDKANGWKKQGLMTGKHRNTMVYHRTNNDGELTVRCETPLPAKLVAPLLAILNETDLYTSWCPSFQRPFKLGVTDTGRHKQCSRACQVAYARVDMPWPMSNREVIAKNVMAEAVDELGCLVVRAKTMEVGEEEDGLEVPAPRPGWERIQMDAGLLLTKCPTDHPALKSKQKTEGAEPMVLATFSLFVSPSVNAVLKVIAGPLWGALIAFAEGVENGKCGELHRQKIKEKPELYSWVDDTVERMIQKCA